MPEDRLHRHDGRQASRRRCRYRHALREVRAERHARRQSMEHGERQVAPLAAAAAHGLQGQASDRLGRQGLGLRAGAARLGLRRRCADRQARLDVEPDPEGRARRDRDGECLGLDVGRSAARDTLPSGLVAVAQLLGRQPDRADPARHLGDGGGHRDRQGDLVAPARPS